MTTKHKQKRKSKAKSNDQHPPIMTPGLSSSTEVTPLRIAEEEEEIAVDEEKFDTAFTEDTKMAMALPLLLKNITLDEIPPVLYLKAVGELFAVALDRKSVV